MPNATKTFQCWRVDDTSANEISMFWLNFFNFRYHWRVNYTSAIKSFNQHLSSILILDVWFTRQWLTFYVFLCCLTCAWHVNDTLFFSLTCGDTSLKRISCTDVSATRQCMPNAKKTQLDVWLTRQCYILFLTDVWSTRHWSEFLLLTCPPHVSACGFLKNLVFSYHWRVDDMSAKP